MQGMRAIVVKVVWQLLFGELNAQGRWHRMAWLAVKHQPVAGLASVA
jgi:hypothetical protein